MQSTRTILRHAVAGDVLETKPCTSRWETIAFFITNNTDISLDFDAQTSTHGTAWFAVEDPSLETQITFTVGAGESKVRYLTGSVIGAKYRLVCDSTGAIGSVTIDVLS